MRVGVVGCGKRKLAHAAPAKELYCSRLFRLSRAYVEMTCDIWIILSALYGVVDPEAVIAPYDMTLVGMPRCLKASWERECQRVIGARWPCPPWPDERMPANEFVILAGAEYWGALDEQPLKAHLCPVAGLGMGRRMQWLAREVSRLEREGDGGKRNAG